MNMTRRALVAAAAMLGAGARAQAPQGQVLRILVGFPPGQATDTVARMLAESLSASLQRPVIVENKPGQGGSIALAMLAKAPRDGSVMTLSALAGYSVNPHLYRNVAYDTLKDFDPIGSVADLPLAMVVHPALPVQDVHELVAYARANPDKLSNCSSGNGTLSHLLMEDFKHRAGGLRIVHVAYQGSPRAMTDLVQGAVQVGLDTIAVTLPLVQAGRLRLVGVGTAKRLPRLPATATIAEQGFPGFEAVAWVGLAAPAGTPGPWREQVDAAVREALATPGLQQKLAALGAFPRPSSVEEFGGLLRSEYVRWGQIVRDTGVQVQ